MTSTTYCSVRLTLFKSSADSFLAALDENNIPHSPIRVFTKAPQASGFVEMITALSDAMPWNVIAKVVISWIESKNSREVIIYTEDGGSIYARGYSASDVQKLLKVATNVVVVDKSP